MSKKRAVFTILTGSLAVVLLSGVLLLGLKNNGFGFLRATAQEKDAQPFGNDYAVEFDPAEDPVEELEISWEAGPVQVLVGTSSRIRVLETSSRKLSDEEHMMVMVNKGKLEIQWDHNKFRFLPLPFFSSGEKSLLVEVPESLAKALDHVEVSNTSGGTEVDGLVCGDAVFSSVSGEISLTDLQCEDEIEISTTSGTVTVQQLSAGAFSGNTTSGDLYLEDLAVTEADLDTVSGELYFQGETERFSHSAISGAAHAQFMTCPEELDMNAVSGQITVELPKNASFRAEHSSVSGEFGCDFAGKQGSYGSGKPQGNFEFSTTSGDILILQS